MTHYRSVTRMMRTTAAFAAAAVTFAAFGPAMAAPETKAKAQAEEVQTMKKVGKKYCRPVDSTNPDLKNAMDCRTREQWIADKGIDPKAPR